mgnify:FL=1
MSTVKFKPVPEPRGWTQAQVAARLGRSSSWLRKNKDALYRNGMPRPDPLLGNATDSKALEAWMDHRSGLTAQLSGLSLDERRISPE